jgi:hypothetical protein
MLISKASSFSRRSTVLPAEIHSRARAHALSCSIHRPPKDSLVVFNHITQAMELRRLAPHYLDSCHLSSHIIGCSDAGKVYGGAEEPCSEWVAGWELHDIAS